MKSLSSSRREVLVDCFHVYTYHIGYLLPGSAVLQHPAALTNIVRSHNRAANTDFCPTLLLRLTQHMYVRKSSQAMPARHVSARPI